MKTTKKYTKLDHEAIRLDYQDFYKKHEGEYMITPVMGVNVDLTKLLPDEKVCMGDGVSFHFRLKKVKP